MVDDLKLKTETVCVVCEVRTEAEEKVDELKLKTETDCVVCEVRIEAEETVDDLKLKTETVCVVCEVRSATEEAVKDLNIKSTTIDFESIEWRRADCCYNLEDTCKGSTTKASCVHILTCQIICRL